jgi:putative transposase
MSHSYVSNRLHIVFSTEGRRNLIAPELEPKLWAYIRGIGKNHRFPIFAIGGTRNHLHLLLPLPAAESLAKAVQTLKANSSKWINEHGNGFAWQEGYGAFSVSASAVSAVTAYIENQTSHHVRQSFEDEFRILLNKHGIEFDEKFLFG